uniref:Uncharacterized protein n=1 Tax=Triticum urartu TaxID=4572 RepID=A0A8R7QDB9_TRIUA
MLVDLLLSVQGSVDVLIPPLLDQMDELKCQTGRGIDTPVAVVFSMQSNEKHLVLFHQIKREQNQTTYDCTLCVCMWRR